MKTLYIECNMGAAGDMLTAALLELQDNKEEAIKKLNEMGIPGVQYEAVESAKCGIVGTHMIVKVHGHEEESHDVHHHHHHDHDHHDHEHGEHHHDHEHHHHHSHNNLHGIWHILEHMNVDESIRKKVMETYMLIAEAESHAHGAPIDQIHFHEVGELDAVADVAAVAYLMEQLDVDKVIVSPINTGKGQVKCAHGIIPVPAPATAHILQGAPTYSNFVDGELCTPTGAALLKYYATEFGNMPIMTTEKVGYGMGKKDFEVANCVRVMLGETGGASDSVIELNCNVDDMTGEELGFATEEILAAGAREVFVTPVIMKKSRPGHMITVICTEDMKTKMVEAIFKHTTTIGIRETEHPRYVLHRSIEEVETEFGSIRRKMSSGYGIKRAKYEYEDLARVARENGISIEEVKSRIK